MEHDLDKPTKGNRTKNGRHGGKTDDMHRGKRYPYTVRREDDRDVKMNGGRTDGRGIWLCQ